MAVRVALFIIAVLSAAVSRAATGADHVKVDLIADTSAVQLGHLFTLGVRFKIDPGWHIYWTNPGDSGLPTRIKLDLPAGLTAGPVEYPVPSVLRFPGGIVNYGYERAVVLLVPITATAATTGRVTAHVDYLVCSEKCLPGKATATLDLPTPLIDPAAVTEWARRLPAEPPNGLSAEYARKGLPADTGYHVTVRWPARSRPAGDDVQWLPPAIGGFDVADVSVVTRSGVTDVDFTLTPAGKRPLPESVDGLLIYTPAGGVRTGVRLPIYPARRPGSLPFTTFFGSGS